MMAPLLRTLAVLRLIINRAKEVAHRPQGWLRLLSNHRFPLPQIRLALLLPETTSPASQGLAATTERV
jgi:hypothetical protein